MKPIAYDTETTGLYRHRGAEMFSFSTLSPGDAEASVHRLPSRRLEELWGERGRRRYAKVMHNARFDLGMTEKRLGRSLRGHEIHETMALSHIFRSDLHTHKLSYLGWLYFGYDLDLDAKTHCYMSDERGLADAPPEQLDPYSRADAERTMLLFLKFHPRLKAEGFEEIYEMERRLTWTILAMEDRGVMIDRRATARMRDWCQKEADRAREDVHAVAGERVNPGSHDQVRFLLYEQLGMPVVHLTKKSKVPSTDADALKALEAQTKHPVLDALLRYSAYNKGVGTLESYLELADDEGVLHSTINPYVRTGRTSSSSPNLQNVAKSSTLKVRYPIPMRKLFRPRPGFVNIHIDYKGIQARQLVNASGDKNMLKIFLEGDGDIHAPAAECFYGDRFRRGVKAKRKSMRGAAKNAVYATGFGAQLAKVAATLGMTEAEAAPGWREFSRRFPDYVAFNHGLRSQIRRDGFIHTTFGRKLYVPRNMPHKGANYWIQGDEAGVVKRACNRIDEYLYEATSNEAGLIMIIHDEPVIEWPRDRLGDLGECMRELRRRLIDFPQFDVPYEVDAKVSTANWETARGYDFAA